MKLLERARRDPARAVRQGLLALVVVVSASVAWSLWRTKSTAVEPLPSPSPGASGTTVGELTFLRFKDDSRRIEVKAREMQGGQDGVMVLLGVEASLPYVSDGRPGTVTITSDECQYQQALERAAFKGNVILRTADGFELRSERLKYWGDKGRAFTTDPISYKRGALSGTAVGFEYRTGSGVEVRGGVMYFEGVNETNLTSFAAGNLVNKLGGRSTVTSPRSGPLSPVTQIFKYQMPVPKALRPPPGAKNPRQP